MKVVLPLVHLDNLVFTPLPQLLLKQQLVLDGVCSPEEVVILEFSREDDLAAAFTEIVSHRPDVVGWSAYVWNFRAVRQVSKALKDYSPQTRVVWGGPHVSEKPRWFAQTYQDCVDYVVGWYGELSFSQLVKQLQHGDPDPDKAPAYTAGSDGGFTKAPEFDELPFPYHQDWFPETMTRDIEDRVFLYETYRNCPFACEYCLAGDTKVNTNKGMVTIRELAAGMLGSNFKVFTYDQGENCYKISPALHARKTGEGRHLVRVVFKESTVYESVLCTPDHRFLVRSGNDLFEAEASHLSSGSYLVSLDSSLYAWTKDKRVERVECVPGFYDVYCLEVPETGWFFAENVLVKNCLWGKASNKIEGAPYDKVMAGFEQLLSMGMKHLKFADAGLGVVKKDNRDKRIWRTLADMDLHKRGVHLRTYFFWQVIDEEWAEIFAKLISQGVIGTMDLGIQTFNPKALTDMKRPTDYDRFDRVTKILQRHKIPYSIDLILGLPGDNLDGFRHSVRKCIDYQPKRFQSFLCSVLPGAGYDIRREELGIKTIAGSLMDDDEKVVETKTFPREDVQKALDLEAWLYLVFSLQVCDGAVRKAALDSGVDPLSVVESLKSWCSKKAPHVTSAIQCYRRNLYDSRQKGRVQCDESMASCFKEIYLELMEWASLMGVEEEMRDGLLKFPKSRETARTLGNLDGPDGLVSSHWDGHGSLRQCNSRWEYQWKEDPIMGVIGTKYAFWTWDKVEVGEEVPA